MSQSIQKVKQEFIIPSLEKLPAVAEQIMPLLSEGEGNVIAFYGAMGVGKTTLICELCRCLGVTSIVNSPTFALINEYFTDKGESIFHFDFYRINSISEAYDFGYEEYFYGKSLCFVEWPEKIESLLPENTTFVILNENPDGSRHVMVTNEPVVN